MPRKAATTKKSSRSRAPAKATNQQSPDAPVVDLQALANAQAIALSMSPSSQKAFFKANPEDKVAHVEMSKNLQAYVDLHKCLPKKLAEAATNGAAGWVTVPGMGLCLVGGGWFLVDRIIDMFVSE